jgi:hypothetical protein
VPSFDVADLGGISQLVSAPSNPPPSLTDLFVRLDTQIIPRTQEETREFALLEPELELLLERLVHSVRVAQEESTRVPNDVTDYECLSKENDSASRLQLSHSASAAIDQAAQVATLSFREQRINTARSCTMRIGYELVRVTTLEACGEQNDDDEATAADPSFDPPIASPENVPLAADDSLSLNQELDSVSESIRYPLTAFARDWEDYWAVTDDEEPTGHELTAPADDAVEVVLSSCLEETESLVENADNDEDDWMDEKKEDEEDDDDDNVNDIVDGDGDCLGDGGDTAEVVGLRRRPQRQALHVVLYRQD